VLIKENIKVNVNKDRMNEEERKSFPTHVKIIFSLRNTIEVIKSKKNGIENLIALISIFLRPFLSFNPI